MRKLAARAYLHSRASSLSSSKLAAYLAANDEEQFLSTPAQSVNYSQSHPNSTIQTFSNRPPLINGPANTPKTPSITCSQFPDSPLPSITSSSTTTRYATLSLISSPGNIPVETSSPPPNTRTSGNKMTNTTANRLTQSSTTSTNTSNHISDSRYQFFSTLTSSQANRPRKRRRFTDNNNNNNNNNNSNEIKENENKSIYQERKNKFFQRVYYALRDMIEVNENFEVIVEENRLKIDAGPNKGVYLIEADENNESLIFRSPVTPSMQYIYDDDTGGWVGEADNHSFEGLITRDLIRICKGYPDF